jgi:hypothetical protein
MIDAFMKTRPIFQPPHFKDFMDLTDVMYSPALHEKIKFIIAGGEGSPMRETNFEQDLMYPMFNVDNNMISNLTTLTIVPYKPPITFVVHVNSPATPTILLNENASAYQEYGAILQNPITLQVCNNSTKTWEEGFHNHYLIYLLTCMEFDL